MSRRAFITGTAALLATAASPVPVPASDNDPHEADFYQQLGDGIVACNLCPHGCTIRPGRKGLCNVRENIGGKLFSSVYGRPCSLHLDPIEKKPFFHVLPGSSTLSLSTVGCNMTCKFCQNWQISQSRPEDVPVRFVNPGSVVSKAVDLGVSSIAYTYGEPVVFFEYMRDIAVIARERSIMSVVVTNGYYTKNALTSLCHTVDAIKIDLKAFDDKYYRDICGARLKPVLDSLITIKREGVWLEIVYLMIPGLNDDPGIIRNMSRWIASNLGTEVPVHFSRFYPGYLLSNLPPTPVSSLERAWEVSREAGLNYVYIGNVANHRAESTYCHHCGSKIISRTGYRISSIDLLDGKCRFCNREIPGLWQEAAS